MMLRRVARSAGLALSRACAPVLATAIATAMAACGSSDDGGGAVSHPSFDGVYRPMTATTAAGDIGAIVFNGNHYMLIPADCSSSSCNELGTFEVDSEGVTMTLTENSGRMRKLPVKVLETAGAESSSAGGSSLLKSIHPLDETLVNGQTTMDQGPVSTTTGQVSTTNGQKQLAGNSQQLLQQIIQALLGGQKMQADQGGSGSSDGSGSGGSGSGGDTTPTPTPTPTPTDTPIDCSKAPGQNATALDLVKFLTACPNGATGTEPDAPATAGTTQTRPG